MMKLSLPTSHILKRYGYELGFRLVAEAGFDGVDHSFDDMCRDDSPFVGDEWKHVAHEAKRYATENGIEIVQAHAPFSFSSKTWKDQALYESIIAPRILRSIEIAAIMGAEVIVVHPLHHFVYEGHEEEIFEKNVEYYRTLIPYAKEYGIRIGVENMWQLDARRKYIVHDTCSHKEEFVRYIDALDSEYITACLDIGHVGLIQQSDEAWDFVKALGHDRLGALHVHDNNYREDTHSLPYYGKIDWQKVTAALGEIDYAGNFNYETNACLWNMDDEFFSTGLKYMADVGRHLMKLVDRNRP